MGGIKTQLEFSKIYLQPTEECLCELSSETRYKIGSVFETKSYNMMNAYVQNRQQPRLEVLFEIARILEVEAKDLIERIWRY